MDIKDVCVKTQRHAHTHIHIHIHKMEYYSVKKRIK